jgi:hypothetical protein
MDTISSVLISPMKHDLHRIDDILFVIGSNYKSDAFPYLVIEKLATDQLIVWQVDNPNDCDEKNQYQILAHRPLNGAAYIENIPVLPPLENFKSLEIDEIAREFYWKRNPNRDFAQNSRPDMVIGFVAGYTEALEKHSLTLRKLLDLYIEETGYGMDMWSKEENETMSTVAKIILSLQQPELPVAFECEVEPKFKLIGSTKEVKGSGHKIKNKCAGNPKTFINSENRTEWIGKYID